MRHAARSRWMHRSFFFASCVVACTTLLLLPKPSRAEVPDRSGDWVLRTRGVASGSSTHSEPAGYKVYTGLGIEAVAGRRLSRLFDLELGIRTESREVDVDRGTGSDERLGSLEFVPLSLMVNVFPLEGSVRPYLGAGVNLTLCWEKTGALDNTQVSPSVGPALQAGVDVAVSSVLALNLNVGWNLFRADVNQAGTRLARLQIDPLTLGVGVSVRL